MAFKMKILWFQMTDTLRKRSFEIMIPKTPEGEMRMMVTIHMNKIAKEKGLDLTDPRQRRRG